MDERRFELRWRHHQSTVVGAVDALYRDAALVDVTLACEDQKTCQAHKLVLSACSHYFQSLFTRHHTDHHPIIFLKDVTGEECEILLAFMYRGEVSVPHDKFERILRVANSLQVRGLAEFESRENSCSRPSSRPSSKPSSRPSSPARASTERSRNSPSLSPTIVDTSQPMREPTPPSPASSQPPNSSAALQQQQSICDPPRQPSMESSPKHSLLPPTVTSPIPSTRHLNHPDLRSQNSLASLAASCLTTQPSALHSSLSSHRSPHSIHHHPGYPYPSPLGPHFPVHTSAQSRSTFHGFPSMNPPSSLFTKPPDECKRTSHSTDHEELKSSGLLPNYNLSHSTLKRDMENSGCWDSGASAGQTDLDSPINHDPPVPPPHHGNSYLPHLLSMIRGPHMDHHASTEAPPSFGVWNGMFKGLPPRNVPPPIGSEKQRPFSVLDPILRSNETRVHKCHFCHRKFKRKDHLKTHVRIHTGERPYKCKICNRGFIQSQQVKIHMKVHIREDSSGLGSASSLCGPGGLTGLGGGGGLMGHGGPHHSMNPLFSSYNDHNSRSYEHHDSHTDLDTSLPSMNLDSDNDCSSEIADVKYDMQQELASADRTPPRSISTGNATGANLASTNSSSANSTISENNNASPNHIGYTNSDTNLTNTHSKRIKMSPKSPASPPAPTTNRHGHSSSNAGMDDESPSLHDNFHMTTSSIKK